MMGDLGSIIEDLNRRLDRVEKWYKTHQIETLNDVSKIPEFGEPEYEESIQEKIKTLPIKLKPRNLGASRQASMHIDLLHTIEKLVCEKEELLDKVKILTSTIDSLVNERTALKRNVKTQYRLLLELKPFLTKIKNMRSGEKDPVFIHFPYSVELLNFISKINNIL